MRFLSLEHSKTAYGIDLALHAVATPLLAILLLLDGPRPVRVELLALAGLGLCGWTLAEYVLHRFVLHGLQPFAAWHAEHHARPHALLCTPTWISVALIAALVFIPAWALFGPWHAGALALGIQAGYLAYSLTHHATHHQRPGSGWLRRRKQWHATHHRAATPCCYGVTTRMWDHVFRSAPQRVTAPPLP